MGMGLGAGMRSRMGTRMEVGALHSPVLLAVQFFTASWLFCRFVTSKEQFHAYLRANGELGGQGDGREEEKEASSEQNEPPAKRGRLDVQGQDGESPGEPEDGEKESRDGEKEPEDGEKEPVERKRARGQNKSRPCMKPNHYEKSRLCPSVTQV